MWNDLLKVGLYDIQNTLKYIVKDIEFSEVTDPIIDIIQGMVHDELHITKGEAVKCLKKVMACNYSVSQFYVQTRQRMEKFENTPARTVSHFVYAIITIECLLK